jgi:type VI secretion system protein ImpL
MLQMSAGAGSEAMEPIRAYAMTAVMSSANAAAFPAPLSNWYAVLMGGAVKETQTIVQQGVSSDLKAKGGSACTTDVTGLYPFDRASNQDLSPARFAELFAPNGSLESTLRTHFSECLDTRSSPWRWKQSCPLRSSLPPAAPGQFERARRIRDTFFSGGGDRVQVEFALTPVVIDSKNVAQVTIRVGQDVFEMGHGPQRRKAMVWQANGEIGTPIEIAFEPLPGAGMPAKTVVGGTWSLLRWLDASWSGQVGRGEGIELQVAADGYRATVRFESRKLEQLLADSDWRSFSCPM